MSNTTRLIVALLIAGALAALATPELSSKLPPGVSTIIATALAAVLNRMNAEAPAPSPAPTSPARLELLDGGKEDDSDAG
jgi:hypothetical protein